MPLYAPVFLPSNSLLPVIRKLLLLVLLRHYSPLWTLASNTVFIQSVRFLTTVCQFLCPIFKLSSNSSSIFSVVFLFCLFLPLSLLLAFFRYSPLSVCPRNVNLCDFINFTKLLHVHIYHTKVFFWVGGDQNISYKRPLENSKSIHAFWGHLPGFRPAA